MHIVFFCLPAHAVPGCVERVAMYTPCNQAQQVRNPQNGQVMAVNPPQIAWNWLTTQGLIFPQGVNFEYRVISPAGQNPAGADTSPAIWCVQETRQTVERTQVNAPYAQPVGNGRQLTEPPVLQPKNAPRTVPAGCMEDLGDAGLAINSDTVVGDMDGAAGTFTDIDSLGQETMRQMYMPQSQKRVG